MTTRKEKLVVVTGGSRGIGRALVKLLSTSGYDVVFTYEKSEAQANALQSELADMGITVDAYRCNGRSAEEVSAWAANMTARHGAPYAVINNAGIAKDALMMSMTDDEWQSVIDSNLSAAFYVTRALLPSMLPKGDGVILQISSVSAFKGNVGQVNYAASKAAMIAMTKSLAAEVARFNIRVNAIAPGYIATEMMHDIPDQKLKSILRDIPLKRMGDPDDVAEMASYLLSPQAAYVTGQTFVIDGGLTL